MKFKTTGSNWLPTTGEFDALIDGVPYHLTRWSEPSKKEEKCNCISCHRFPQWVQDTIAVNIKKVLDDRLKDAGLMAHSKEEQELAQWKGLALAMSKLILENVK